MTARTIVIPDIERMNELMRELMLGVNAQLFNGAGGMVNAGPFRDMEIPMWTPWDDGNSSTKLLGVYEHELHDALSRALDRNPELIINVGCAEGYYAVGLAMIAPYATVHAADINPESVSMCRYYAERNGVADRVHLFDGCRDADQLNHISGHQKRRFYLIDCEGAERTILDKEFCPPLVTSDIIVECHDFLDKDISSVLTERFKDTHEVEVIEPRLPNFHQFGFLRNSPSVMCVLAVTEKRPMPCRWLALWTKNS